MKAKDIFYLGIRLLGLVFLYHGLILVPGAISQISGAFPYESAPGVTEQMNFGRFVMEVFIVVWPLLVAWWLIRGAPQIKRMAYPDPEATAEGERRLANG